MAEMHKPTQGRTARFRAALLGSVAILGLGLVAIEQPAWSQSSPPPANATVAPSRTRATPILRQP